MFGTNSRRSFVGGSLYSFVLSAISSRTASSLTASRSAVTPSDSELGPFAHLFDVDRSTTNLENAYFGVMPRAVANAYEERFAFVNLRNVVYVRDGLPNRLMSAEIEESRQSVAGLLRCAKQEVAFSRSGTESLQNLIANYKLLKPGDVVLYSDLDFDAMQFAMNFLEERRGVKVVRFAIPEPATAGNVLEAYQTVLRTPRAKLLLLTHLSHRTGLVLPVRKIADLAHLRGVDVILDAAQSLGQLEVVPRDLGVEFMGFSLHKWIGAPLGTGGMFIAASRLPDIAPCHGNEDWPEDDIRARVLTGTSNFAATLAVRDAVELHQRLGVSQKLAYLHQLRNRWVDQVSEMKSIRILTPNDPAMYGATTSFRTDKMKTYSDAQKLQQLLLRKYGILTAARKGIAGGAAVRVTPSLYNSLGEIDRLASALKKRGVKCPHSRITPRFGIRLLPEVHGISARASVRGSTTLDLAGRRLRRC